MKKSIILLIFVIYVASIVIIGFFGVKLASYDPVIYVKQIEILNDDLRTNADGDKYILHQFVEGELNVVTLFTKVWPENATKRNVTYSYSSNDKVEIDKIGNVIFSAPTTVTVYIRSQDGANITEKITIIARK